MTARSAAGFTLVEMLVALAIAGLVSLLALDGIALAARSLDRLTQHTERLDQRRSLEMLLRRGLATAVAVPSVAGEPGFVGRPTSITFLCLIEDGGPGLYRYTIALDAGSVTAARRLARRSAPPRDELSIVIPRVARFAIDYFGAAGPGDDPAWHRQWVAIARLPQLVRITFDPSDGGEVPPIVARIPDAG